MELHCGSAILKSTISPRMILRLYLGHVSLGVCQMQSGLSLQKIAFRAAFLKKL